MIKAVLFDLDGTLADTARDLGAALNRLLAEEGLPPQPYEAVRPIASHGARGLVSLGFGIDKNHPRFEEYRLRFLDHYEHSFADKTVLFDDINPLIDALQARNLQWGIITNKPMRFTDRLVPALPFASKPAVVVSGDTVGVAKPDPAPMLHATQQLGIAVSARRRSAAHLPAPWPEKHPQADPAVQPVRHTDQAVRPARQRPPHRRQQSGNR
ncbi:HAD family hydrolase [Vogesella oryzae]|uniref:HAD family hydrolase n=1 Tax=Vogesella oryzae TaxID=1735285 RepID=UPI001582C086|nr:HAD hydrolase-like protein [Vogesella oryzae]